MDMMIATTAGLKKSDKTATYVVVTTADLNIEMRFTKTIKTALVLFDYSFNPEVWKNTSEKWLVQAPQLLILPQVKMQKIQHPSKS